MSYQPVFQIKSTIITEGLDAPLLKAPLFTSEAVVSLIPHLIDSISFALPLDAWEYESIVIEQKTAPFPDLLLPKLDLKDDKALCDLIINNLYNDKRGHVVANLYETERNYVRDLDLILNIYRKRIQNEEIISEIASRNIFNGIDQLHSLHVSFFNSMESLVSVETWSNTRTLIGKLFKEHITQFDTIYINYIDAYALSHKEIKTQSNENQQFVKLLSEIMKLKECNRQSLKELLITPVQRTTRYHLFLKDLEKMTDDDHPDKQDLKIAWTAMTNLAKIVNDKKRSEEERTGLFDAFESTRNCPATLINSRRRMIISVDAIESKSGKSFRLFLCSDLLMIATNIKQSGVLSGIIGKADSHLHKFVKNVDLLDAVVEELAESLFF